MLSVHIDIVVVVVVLAKENEIPFSRLECERDFLGGALHPTNWRRGKANWRMIQELGMLFIVSCSK